MMREVITGLDWLLLPVYFILIVIIAEAYKGKLADPVDRKYFSWGLYAKLLGGIFFALVYAYYYKGGDTINYWYSAKCLINLSHTDFESFWKLMLGSTESQYMSAFDGRTGYPLYRHDPNAFAVNRFMVPVVWLGAKRFLLSTVVLSGLLYILVFRFYLFVRRMFPDQAKIVAVAILLVPSVLVWSSGILKDSLTFSFGLMTIVALYNLIIKPHRWLWYLFILIVSGFVVSSIKPYILYALLAAALVWLLAVYVRRIESVALKIIMMPVLSVIIISGGMYAFTSLGDAVGGEYASIDAMAERAVIIQDDLTRDYYGENSFDIGDFEPTIPGMIRKFPKAVMAGLYRPFLWDAGNVLMLLTGVENFILLLLSLFIIFRVGPANFVRQIMAQPFLVFCFVFAIVLSFFIGLTTANFGALVRYRIPMLPMFVFALLYVYETKRQSINKRDKPTTET
jgi:hypothetical protein